MADKAQLTILKSGAAQWNAWREEHLDALVDLCGAKLRGANLTDANLGGAYLTGADLTGANLDYSDLIDTDLSDANLSDAVLTRIHLTGTNLTRANLTGADLTGAHLIRANLASANLTGVNLTATLLSSAHLPGAQLNRAFLLETVFGNVNLSSVKGLDSCQHFGPSIIDHRTLMQSGQIPLVFLRGCGLPDRLIEYVPSLLGEVPIQFYSCFISYSTKDQEFAERLHADLQKKGVRCWFAPEDLKIGDSFRQRIDEAIRFHDRLLLILSGHSVDSDWVRDEVESGLERERREKRTVLFPVRLDDAVEDTTQAWAASIRQQRHIGNFKNWKDQDIYKKTFDRLLRDLQPNDKVCP